MSDDLIRQLERMLPLQGTAVGEQLWRALPAIYRERDRDLRDPDRTGHLEQYIHAVGGVLDGVHHTLVQRLRDISPLTCQEWLLPYFADLLDVRLVSPDVAGQRQEIARAISWRQAKGTISVCVEVVEAVGQAPVVAYEGHRSVATTPSVGFRQSSPAELGEVWKAEPVFPARLAERPGTPAITVDFRKPSVPRRVPGDYPTPQSVVTRFDGEEVSWQRENRPHGSPADGHEGFWNVCMRTVDTRGPTWSQGQHHPKRFRIFTPIPSGFVKETPIHRKAMELLLREISEQNRSTDWLEGPEGTRILVSWDHLTAGGIHYVRIEERQVPGDAPTPADHRQIRIRSTLITVPHSPAVVRPDPSTWPSPWDLDHLSNALTGVVPEEPIREATWPEGWDANAYVLQSERWFDQGGERWHTALQGGTWDLVAGSFGEAGLPIPDRDHLLQEARWPTLKVVEVPRPEPLPVQHSVSMGKLVLTGKFVVEAEVLDLNRIAANQLPARAALEVKARDCLFNVLQAPGARVDLEYCTLGQRLRCAQLRASDCILLARIAPANVKSLRLRYSCAPRLVDHTSPTDWIVHHASLVRDWPVLYHQEQVAGGGPLQGNAFGDPGFGVIHPSTPASIRRGAEDGGELGAYHHRYYSARQDAVLEKLSDFLPVGILPVLVVDLAWRAPGTPMEDSS